MVRKRDKKMVTHKKAVHVSDDNHRDLNILKFQKKFKDVDALITDMIKFYRERQSR